jgi:type IV secretory pathway TrbD component
MNVVPGMLMFIGVICAALGIAFVINWLMVFGFIVVLLTVALNAMTSRS